MKALVLKDIAAGKRFLALTLLISLGICAYGIYEKAILMIPALCGIIPMMISYGYDTRSNFEQLAFSMPIKRSSYVLSRLFFPVLFGMIGGISFFIVMTIEEIFPTNIRILISVLSLLFIVLISTIQMPFIFKFGEEKGRLTMVITYFLIFGLFSQFEGLFTKVGEFFNQLSDYSASTIGLVTIIGLLAIILISIRVSIRLLEKKEY